LHGSQSSVQICVIYGSTTLSVQATQALKGVPSSRLDVTLIPKMIPKKHRSYMVGCNMLCLAHISCKQVQMHAVFCVFCILVILSTDQSLRATAKDINLVSCLTCAAFHSSEPNTFSETLLSAWYPPGCSCTPTFSHIQRHACLSLGCSKYP